MAMEMSERDIYVHWKTAKNRKYEIDVLAQLNGTTPKVIREILEKWIQLNGDEMTEEDKKIMQPIEKERTRKREYMRKYNAKKRAEKADEKAAEATKTPEAEDTVIRLSAVTETEIEKPNAEDIELIRKALLYYSTDLAEAVKEKEQFIKIEQDKLKAMRADLKRCQEMLDKEAAV